MDVYKTLVNKKNKLTEILTDCRPDSNYSKATEKEKFDFYLKQGFINGNTYLPSLKINSSKENFGLYINKYKRYYDRYFSDEIGIKDYLSFEIQKSYPVIPILHNRISYSIFYADKRLYPSHGRMRYSAPISPQILRHSSSSSFVNVVSTVDITT